MTYKAVIVELENVRKHPNADRLQLADCAGETVVVGLEQYTGEIGVYFPTDGQLSQEFCDANDLIARMDPVTNKKIGGGMFDAKRRVRAMSIRGIKSFGFWISIESLRFTGANPQDLKQGYEFDSLGGVPICSKYVTPATQSLRRARGLGHKGETKWFPMHVDTSQFARKYRDIPLDSILTISEKLHGTSGRVGYSLTPKRQHRLARLLHLQPKMEYKYTHGSRRVILEEGKPDTYYNDEFRVRAMELFRSKLHKGEVVFFEIVGYDTGGKPIMVSQDTHKMDSIRDQYGDTMIYSYGCEPGQSAVFVYRMVSVDEDGYQTEYPWPLILRRCAEMDVRAVPHILTLICRSHEDVESIVDGLDVVAPSLVDSRHMREGIVIRVDTPDGDTYWLKQKPWEFLFMEGVLKEMPDYVDAEEAA